MKKIVEKWWKHDRKCFQITNYKKAWKENGNKSRLSFHTNGGSRRKGDNCFDCTLIIGYTVFNYTHFDMQYEKREREKKILVKQQKKSLRKRENSQNAESN